MARLGLILFFAWLAVVSVAAAQPPVTAGDEARQSQHGPTMQDEDRARTLFEQAVEALEAERWAEARELLARSLEHAPRPSTQYNYGLACWRTGAVRESVRVLEQLIGRPTAELAEGLRAAARQLLQDARSDLSTVRVRLQGSEAAQISLDGEDRGIAAPEILLDADPGRHVVRAIFRERGEASEEFLTERGEFRGLLLRRSLAPEAGSTLGSHEAVGTDPALAESGDGEAQDTGLGTGWIVGGIVAGALLVAGGVVLAVVASGGNDAVVDPITGQARLAP